MENESLESQDNNNSLTFKQYLLKSLGYFIVIFLCAYAGFSISSFSINKIVVTKTIFINQASYIFYFSILFFPYFLSREVLLEQKKRFDINVNKALKTPGIECPIFIFFSFATIIVLALQTDKNFVSILILLFLSILPAIGFFFRTIYLLYKNKFDRAYSFSESVLLPAIYVCIVSVSFGWTLGKPDLIENAFFNKQILDFYIILISIIFIFILSILVIFLKSEFFAQNIINNNTLNRLFEDVSDNDRDIVISSTFVTLFVLIYVSFIYYTTSIDGIKPLVSAIILTLVMGVAESLKRTIKASKNKSRVIAIVNGKKEDYEFYYKGTLSAGLTVPFLLPLLLLIFLNNIPMYIVYIVIAFQTLHIYLLNKNENYLLKKEIFIFNHSNIALFIGYSLPFTLILSSILSSSSELIQVDKMNDIIGIVAFFIGVYALIKVYLIKKEDSEDETKQLTFIDKRYRNIVLSIISLIAISFGIAYSVDIFKMDFDSNLLFQGSFEIFIYSIIYFIFLTITHSLRKKLQENQENVI